MPEMGKTFTVLVMEDNQYYNILLTRTLLNTCSLIEEKFRCSVRLLSFTDPGECLLKIRSGEFNKCNVVAFIDYYTGDEINGCLLYTSDAADDLPFVDLGGRRIIQKKTTHDI